jgi:hypothetical protein
MFKKGTMPAKSKASRPKTIQCKNCRKNVKVAPKGRVPALCKDCRGAGNKEAPGPHVSALLNPPAQPACRELEMPEVLANRLDNYVETMRKQLPPGVAALDQNFVLGAVLSDWLNKQGF